MGFKSFIKRGIRGIVHLCVLVALGLPLFFSAPPRPAGAQERRTIFNFLFGRQQRDRAVYDDEQYYERAPAEPRQGQPKTRKPKQKATTAPASVTSTPVAVEKRPDAKKVLVVGDFIAGSLGDGLKAAFEDTPGITIETRADGSSGLVREDYFDWPQQLPVYVSDIKPALIIISLGANDRQQMRIGAAKEKFETDAWTAAYVSRIQIFAEIARKQEIPLLWVGMPSFQSSAMTADMVTFNGYFRTAAEKVGGQFIDIWDGFVDEGGKFVLTGSDINGQQVRLRGADGINMTKAGKRKLAFYVEKDIRRLLGDASSSDLPATDGLTDLVVSAPVANEDILRTQPISLDDPELDGGTALLGGTAPVAATGKSPRDLLVGEGKVAEAPPGRVDDFRLAKPETVLSNPVIRN